VLARGQGTESGQFTHSAEARAIGRAADRSPGSVKAATFSTVARTVLSARAWPEEHCRVWRSRSAIPGLDRVRYQQATGGCHRSVSLRKSHDIAACGVYSHAQLLTSSMDGASAMRHAWKLHHGISTGPTADSEQSSLLNISCEAPPLRLCAWCFASGGCARAEERRLVS